MDIIKNSLRTVGIMAIATIVALIFNSIGLKESNIVLVFSVAIIFISKFTDGYIYGIISSVSGALCFNFFFTKPYYTFYIEEPDYITTVIIMLTATLLTSTSTSKVKQEAKEYALKEQRLRVLYENNKKLLNATSKQEIIKSCADSLGEMLNRNIFIVVKNDHLGPVEYEYNRKNELGYLFESEIENSLIKDYLYLKKVEIEIIKINGEKSMYYYPIQGKKNTLGVICIEEFIKNPILEKEKIMLNSIIAQVALAIEKEELYEENKINSIQVNRERTRGNLLRSISHDLRTPLASIMGSTSTILDNYDKIDDNSKKELLNNIYDDSNWLTRTVENVLSVTKMDEGKLEVHKNIEVAEEIVSDALKRTNHLSSDRNIQISLPKEIIVINIDGLLIRQVLVNLIDNAIRYTSEGSEINISIEQNLKNTIFKVSDNGKGIPKKDIANIFDRFYTKSGGQNLEQRGIGLGLAICKSIVRAHGGEIYAYNNKNCGATFEFKIPNS